MKVIYSDVFNAGDSVKLCIFTHLECLLLIIGGFDLIRTMYKGIAICCNLNPRMICSERLS